VNLLIGDGWSVGTVVYDVTDDVVRDKFNTRFSSCHSSFDEVGEAQCLDNVIEEDKVVYHAHR
jgi:hypothetical protein